MKYIKEVYLDLDPVRFVPYLCTVDEDGDCRGYSADSEGGIKKTLCFSPDKNPNLRKTKLAVGTLILLREVRLVGDIDERRRKFLDYR